MNRKVKKGKKKQPMKQSGSNQDLVQRLRELNQEKFLLLKQLHLQRQIDENTSSFIAASASKRCAQGTARATDRMFSDRMPTSTKRKKSSGASTTKRLEKSMKEKYVTTQTFKSTGKQYK